MGTALETVIVLASDVSFVFRSMGREIGGIVAQFNALGEGGGIFSAEGRAAWTRVGEMIREDAVKSRQELDKFQAAVMGASDRVLQQRDALKNSVVATSEMGAEVARLTGRYGEATLKTLENKTATEQKKTAVDQAARSTRDYLDQLDGQLAALNAQISLGRELTTGERERLKLEEDVRSGKKRLTEAELESARAKLAERDALTLQAQSLKEQETARRNAERATADYTSKLGDSLAALNLQISAGRVLTDTERELIRVEEAVRTGKMLLTEAELASVRAKLAERDALNEQIETLKRAEKATQEAASARVKQSETVADATAKIREDIEAQRNANETIRTGKERTDELAVAKLREAAASADRQAIIAMERLEDEILADQFRDQARALRELADEKEKGVHVKTAKEAAEAWKKTSESITQGLTDALMRGFESGKGFVENLVDYVRNRFKTMVAEYIVKPLMEPLGQAIASMMSPVRDAISGIMSGISGQIGSYISQLTGLSLNFAGSAAGSAAGAAGSSSLGSAVGSAIGSAVLGSSAAYGAAIGTTSIGAGSQAAMLASQTGVFGAAGLSATAGAAATAGSTAAGSAAAGSAAAGSGVSSFLSAAAPWAAAALATYLIYKSVDRSGTPHMGASVAADFSGTSRTDGRSLGFEVTPDDRMASMLSGLAGDIAADLNARRAAAGKPRDVAVELGFADDSSSDGAWGQFRLMVGGRTFAYWGSGDRWPGQGLANGEAGWQQFMQLVGATVASVFDAQMNPRDASVSLPEGGGGTDSGNGPRQGEQPLREVIGLSGVTRQVDEDGYVWSENGRMRGPGGGLLRLVGSEVYDGDSLFGNVVNGRMQRAFALGGAFTNGIVTEPTAFPFGLMGEAGPEAIMPLTRGPDGALGVSAHGGPGSVFSELLREMSRMNAALRAVAENTGKTQRLMQRVTRDGESMQVLDVTPA